MRLFLMQHNMGAHAIPMDDKGRDLLAFLGMIEPQATIDAGAEDLKQVIRKADSQLFCHLFAAWPVIRSSRASCGWTANQALGEGPDATTVVQRMNEILAGQTPRLLPAHPPPPRPRPKPRSKRPKPQQEGRCRFCQGRG